jgi:flagellar biosynthetic protein FliQ
MSPETIMEVYRGALGVMLTLGGPILGVILVMGVTVSVIQAATQVNEMTLSFIPKVTGALLTIWMLGGWLLEQWASYTIELYTLIERVPMMF